MMYNKKLIVVIKSNGKVLREFNDEVYIPFGSDYSIFIKNKDCNKKALVNISIDGKDVLDGNSIVISTNTDIELKGFMGGKNVNNKFRFIEKTDKIDAHRGNHIEDGLVEVTYRFEELSKFKNNIDNMMWIYNYYPTDVKYTSTNYYSSNISSEYRANSSINTDGITVKGQETSQSFIDGYIGNLESLTYTIILKLKGKRHSNRKNKSKIKQVSNPITVKTKLQCSSCGRLWKSSIKFCGSCGTYLN